MATQADGAPEQETGLGLLHRGLPRGILACFGRRLPHPWLRNLQIVVVPAGTQELTLSGQAHAFADQLAKLLELAGVGIIISSVLIATALFVMSGLRDRRWREAYESYRSNLGRGILLGLELLVGADIIFTITAPLTWQSVGLLAGIVVIRTFLSFSLEAEIEGCWPWQRAQRDSTGRTVTKNT